MEPTWSHGEPVPVEIPAGTARFGDVLLLRHPTGPFLHRLVGRPRAGLRTKGDGRGHFDGWLTPPEAVIGRALTAAPLWDRGAACWSALCGHLYRVAFRLDQGPGALAATTFRLDVETLNRRGFELLNVVRKLLAGGPQRVESATIVPPQRETH